jgi:hypothetical protein
MLVHVWFHTGGPFNSYFHHGFGIVLVPELLVLQHPRSFPIRIISFQAGRLTATSLAELNIDQRVTMGNHRWICDNLILAIVNTKPSSFGILDFDPKPSQLRWVTLCKFSVFRIHWIHALVRQPYEGNSSGFVFSLPSSAGRWRFGEWSQQHSHNIASLSNYVSKHAFWILLTVLLP